MMVGTLPTVAPQVQAGKVRALALTGTQRVPLLRDVPTFKESGYPDLDMKDWVGVFVPSATSMEIVPRLNAAVREALKSREVTEAFAKMMVEPGGESPAECANLVMTEYNVWGSIVRASGFIGED
jgi:tripartite-type tricarboxylate transporter receptor subunit TctC